MGDLQPLAYGVITTLYALGTITIFMRIYVRGYTMMLFTWDDWVMSSMLIFSTVQQAILYFFLYFGGGLHIEDVLVGHPEWLPIILKGLLAEEFYYIWMQFSVKMSFLLFYRRLSEEPWFKRALYGVIGFHAATTVVIWLLYSLQCMPLAAFYDPVAHPNVTCLPSSVTYFVPYTLNMTTDFFILILPLPVILTLKMTLRRRLAVLAVVTTGGSAVLVSGLRAIILFEFAASPDFTWALGKMVIISNIEMQVAIIAANMPALKAFYSCWRMHKLGRGQGVHLVYNSKSKRNQSERLDDIEMNRDFKGSHSTGASGGGPQPSSTANSLAESEERLVENSRAGIKLTKDHEEEVLSR